jgi:Circularly permutated YpsA SLOG family
VDLGATSITDAVSKIRAWLPGLEGETLNIAGPRASNDGEIYEKTKVVSRLVREAV